ncbi:MAG: hypothetical protein IIY55_02380, partial [Blautia sp.]|nr:hypothetical protein [Blautia sp.]
LIPVYRGIDPGTLPEGLKELQALDMEKLGYMQDLVHGIQKFTGEKEKPGTEKTPENAAPKIEKWLKRTFLLLEEGNFESAEKYCNQVLDEDPENAGGYLAKLLLERKVKTTGELSESEGQKPLDDDLYYQRILRYGDEEQKAKILSVNQAIHFRVELEKKEERYHEAIALMEEGSRSSVEEAAEKFEELSGYRDSIEKAEECRFNLETKEKDPVYENAVRKLEQSPDDELVLNEVLALLERIRGWKDTDHLLDVAGQKLKDLKEKEEKERQEQERKRIRKKRKRRRRRIVFLLLLVLLAAGLINEWKPVLWPYVSENEDLKTVRTFAEEKLPKEMTSLLSENKSVYARQNVSLYLPGDNTFKETEAGEGTIKFISSYDYVGQALSEALKLSLEEGDVISVVHEYQEGLGAMFDMDTEDIVKAFENAYGYQKDVDYRIVSSMMDKAGRCTGIAYTVNYLGDAVQEASRVKHFRVFISEGEFYGIEADINSENNVKNEMIKASLDSFSLAEESDLKTAIDTLQKRFGLLSPEE